MRPFVQVDVFTAVPFVGNPLAVVLDGQGLTTEQMQAFARWTNLSETTFLLSPMDLAADYRVRIFTTTGELPFAGHPTIGSCHAWIEAGGVPKVDGKVVQECGVGLVSLRTDGGRLAFAAPPLIRGGELSAEEELKVRQILGLAESEIVDMAWADNGPGWIAVLLADAETVKGLNLQPGDHLDYKIGVAGPHPEGSAADLEVRAFYRDGGAPFEDPVTGSLNASMAQWLLGSGRITAPYVAAQGTMIDRAGRVYIDADTNEVWVGGDAVTCISGDVNL